MKSVKKLILVVLIVLIGITLSGCVNQAEETSNNGINIGIMVYDKDENIVYEKEMTTTAKILLEALKEIDDLRLETEDSQYGAFITSINGIGQANDYYWNYYVNGAYATVGVSSCEIKNDDKFEICLEKFEGGM